MRRILVLGSGGAGKSTLALALGAQLGIPVIHLDSFYWQPGWVATPEEHWTRKVSELVQGDAWVMDGNFLSTLDARLSACDTAVFLDLSRFSCLLGIIRRWLWFRGRTRPDLPQGCPECLDWEFMRWVWNYPRRTRPLVLEKLRECANRRQIIVMRSREEVVRWLKQVATNKQCSG